MEQNMTDSEKPALTKGPVEESAPQRPPVKHYTQRVVLDICGRRFEVTHRAEVREVSKRPAKVIEMPKRPT
jgi:hypothetical protein